MKFRQPCPSRGAYKGMLDLVAESTQGRSQTVLTYFTRLDFYNNSSLHCVASNPSYSFPYTCQALMLAARQVRDNDICNTNGETCLHILCRTKARTVEDGYELVELLKALRPLRLESLAPIIDYNGMTFLHTLFRYVNGFNYTLPLVRKLFSTVKLSLVQKDCFGLSIIQYLEKCYEETPIGYNFGSLESLQAEFSQFQVPQVCSCPHFTTDDNDEILRRWSVRKHGLGGTHFPECSLHQECSLKLESSLYPECSPKTKCLRYSLGQSLDYIDLNGDTPLMATIKAWNTISPDGNDFSRFLEIVEGLAKTRSEVHIRDRKGDTALAVAACRGMRQIVLLLINNTANVNCRNHKGLSILSQANRALRKAKLLEDEKLYAAIWSCCMALIDAGAKVEPTEIDEWMSERAKSKLTQSGKLSD